MGVEAKVLGRGGVSAVAVATGVSRTTILAGLNEIEVIAYSGERDRPFRLSVTAAQGVVLRA